MVFLFFGRGRIAVVVKSGGDRGVGGRESVVVGECVNKKKGGFFFFSLLIKKNIRLVPFVDAAIDLAPFHLFCMCCR